MSNEEDPVVGWYESLGFSVRRGPNGDLFATNKLDVMFNLIRQAGEKSSRPVHTSKSFQQKPRWPGEGATDEEWLEYAWQKYQLAGATTELPQIRKGRLRGWDILRLVRGETVKFIWPCGCEQLGSDYKPCGTGSCVVNPSD